MPIPAVRAVEARERAGAFGGAGVERRHVLQVVAVRERVALPGPHRAVRARPVRQQAYRAQGRHAVLDLAHPADRVVDRGVERGYGERRRLGEHHDRRRDVLGLGARVRQHHVHVPGVEPVRHARGGPEHRPGTPSERRDLRPQRGIGAHRRGGRRGDRGGAAALAQPLPEPAGEPPREPPPRPHAPHMPRLVPDPRRGRPEAPAAPAPPGAPAHPRDAPEGKPRGAHRARLAVVGGAPARPAGAVQRPGPRDRHPRPVREHGAGRRGVAERRAQPPHQPAGHGRAAGNGEVQRRHRERIEGRARARDLHPRIRPERVLEPREVLIVPPRRRLDPHRQIARRIGEQRLDGLQQPPGRRLARLDRDRVPGHRPGPPRRGAAESGVRDQVGELAVLAVLIALLARPALGPAPLVPAEGLAHRDQQRAAHLGPVAELGVLAAVAGEGLVKAARFLEQGS